MALEKHSITIEEAKAFKMAATQMLEEAIAERKQLAEKKPSARFKLALKQIKDRFKLALSSKS
jgi:hypothetical protein